MATITAQTGSIDVASIVSQLMAIEKQPVAKLQKTQAGVQTKVSAWGKLQSQLGALQDAVRTLNNTSTWQAAKGTSGDATAVGATVTSGAPPGNYSVRVDRLAQRQTIVSAGGTPSSTVIGGGTLRIQLGTDTGSGFTPDAARPEQSITIAPGSTLADIRTAINTADAGVTAALVTDSSGSRLMLRSKDSGVANAFRIQATDGDGNDADASGLSALTYTPNGSGNMSRTIQARDAEFNLGGLDLTSTSNDVEGVLDGVTLKLGKESATPVEVVVSADTEAMRKAVDGFVKAYNDLNANLSSLTKYDAATKVAGTLQGDRTVLLVQQKLREILGGTTAGGTLTRLSEAGIQLQRDGSLLVSDSKFQAAAVDPRRLQTMFANTDADATRTGFARRFDALLTQMLGTDGSIEGAKDSLNKRIKALTTQQDRLNERLVNVEARLRRTYTQLDSNLSKITGSLSSIDQLTSSG